ncbi:MAG TPA: EAL domain-containing protein, partial [Paraburkholderia sp.]|nr:EAL domain-containing protein [Paraburkholderia sp.]
MTTSAVEQQSQPEGAEEAQCAVHLTRQPLLNRDGMLCGFELKVFFPEAAPQDDAAAAAAPRDAAADAQALEQLRARSLLRTLVRPDVRAALTGHPAYVDASRALLFDEAIKALPPERFIFELPAGIQTDEELIARIVMLHGRRFRFVIDEVTQVDDRFARLLPYAEMVKIDVRRAPAALLPKLSSVLKSAGKILIALGTESHADFETAFELGFDRFQGYFFARPHGGGSTRRVSAPRHALLNLLQLLAGEPTVAQLEAELKLNPVLVMHLMRLANAGALALGLRVTTLRDAINATGTDRIARWTQLLLYADGRKVALEDDP